MFSPILTDVVLFGDPGQFIVNALYLIPALLLGLIGHELAHAAIAVARGFMKKRDAYENWNARLLGGRFCDERAKIFSW